ncbi:MAG: Spy/CpxP family protein refolding chaperone [Terriglobia bacterium]
MKPSIATLVLATVFCGHSLFQKARLTFAAPGQGAPPSMMSARADGPPGMFPGGEGKWWENPELVQKLHVSDEQIQKIKKITQAQQISQVDLRADLEKQETTLRFQMEADPPDEAQIFAQIDKVTQARARLEKSHVETLLAVRHVLTSDQAKMVRELGRHAGPPGPGFGPPDGGPGGPAEGGPGAPPEGGPGGPPGGPPQPPPNGNAN